MNNYNNSIIQEDMESLLNRNINYKRFNGKTFFITGATGLLASYVVYYLIFLNENIDNFNCRIVLALRDIDKAQSRYGEYLKKDYMDVVYCNLDDNIEYDKKVDFIIHAASIADTKYFQICPVDVIRPNIIGTYNLLEFAKEKNVESFLFFSSCSVYGKVENVKSIKENNFGQLDPLDNNSCYSESKRCAESICYAFWKQGNVPIKIVRISHTYGPTIDLKNDSRVFSEFVNSIVQKKDLELKSDGKAIRSFCYIVDATDAFFKILLNGKNGEAYNMSNMNANISIRELAEILAKIYNINIRYIKRDYNYSENKFSNKIVFDTKKLENLGWKAKIGIEEGFMRTIESFENNE